MNQKRSLVRLISTASVIGFFGIWGAVRVPATAHLQVAQASPAPTVQEKIEFRRKTLRTMKDELNQIAALVQSGSYGVAQSTFEKALKKWYTFGGTIKRIAPDSYAKISPNFDAVQKGLYHSEVPLSTLKANLQSLIRDVGVAVTVSNAKD